MIKWLFEAISSWQKWHPSYEGRGNEVAARKNLLHSIRRPRKQAAFTPPPRRPTFFVEIVIADGSELRDSLVREGLAPGEVIFKYCWPRYAPPLGSGIRAKGKSESLVGQFERLLAMHREAPSRFPLPVATVKSTEGGFAGYVLEYVEGDTLQTLIALGMLEQARRQLESVEVTVGRLHGRGMPHGDLNASNIIAADDGRTVLIDPVANPGAGTKLQDEICIAEIRRQIDDAALGC
jgi:hypothetical protein